MSHCSDTATKAASLSKLFWNGVINLGFKLALKIFGPLEELNRSLQSSSARVSGMVEVTEVIKSQLLTLRTDGAFHTIFEEVHAVCQLYEIDPICLSRTRQPPKRFTGLTDAHRSTTDENYHRASFFSSLDTAYAQLGERLDKNSPGLNTYMTYELMLQKDHIDNEVY